MRDKMTASCKCGEKEIDIESITNKHGYIENTDWTCPKCWHRVELVVRKEE